jgi:hypothetical protein
MGTVRRGARILALGLWCAFGAISPALAEDVYYLHTGSLLSLDPPNPTAGTVSVSTSISVGESASLGTFTSAPFDHDATVGDVRAVVFLGTGRPGMDGCARVTATLSRLTAGVPSAVAGGTIITSIQPRRRVTEPIVVQMALASETLAATGDRLAFEIRVDNECSGGRSVSLLYDSVGRASRVEILKPGETTTTTTTTTTSTSSTTTTLPPTCFDTSTGLALVRCRLEAMDALIRGTSPADLGGARFRARLERRVDRALALVRAAQLVSPTPRRLKRARKQLARFEHLVAKGRTDGRVETTVGDSLDSLATGATTDLTTLLTHP